MIDYSQIQTQSQRSGEMFKLSEIALFALIALFIVSFMLAQLTDMNTVEAAIAIVENAYNAIIGS